MQRNFGSSLNRRLAARKGLAGLVLVLYPTGKSDPGAQTYRFISCCEKRRSDTACVRSCPLSSIERGNYRKYVEGNHIIIQSSGEASDNNNIKYENTASRALPTRTIGTCSTTSTMNSGSSQDTTWTFGGAVAAPAAGESTAEEVAMQSIDSSTEEDKAKPTSAATPKTVPKAKNASRASTPSRPTSLGSRAAKGNGRESDAPSLPVMQAVRMTAKRKARATDRVSKPSSSRSSSSRRSRGSTKVRGRSQTTTGRRILSSETDEQPVPLALTHSNDVPWTRFRRLRTLRLFNFL